MKTTTLITVFVSVLFNGGDLLNFLSEYGQTESDYIPTWNNFFQDASCNVAQWQYTGAEADAVQWILNGDTITNAEALKFETPFNCGGYLPPCNGAHDCTVRVTVNGAIFERSAIGWARVNGLDLPSCQLQVFDVEPSGTFWQGQPIEFEPFEFLVEPKLKYDLNGDHIVNGSDLLIFLTSYGE